MTVGFCVGIGLSSKAEISDVIELVELALTRGDIAATHIACIATIEARAGNALVGAIAARYGAIVRSFDAAALEAETPRLKHPSAALFTRIGCHGVAEAAALAAAGPDARLVVERLSGPQATVAIAF